MKKTKEHIDRLNREIDQLKRDLNAKEDELNKKDELLGIYWDKIQSMRLINRMRSLVGVFWFRRNYNYFKANPFLISSKTNKLQVCIKLPAPDWLEAHTWGDFYFAISLKKSLEKLDYHVRIQTYDEWYKPSSYDVAIVLRGPEKYQPRNNILNIMWNISHPKDVSDEEYAAYDHVFVASKSHAHRLSLKLGSKVSALLQCSDTSIFYPKENRKNDQIVFVGNSHGVFRPIVKDVLELGYNIKVYGVHWEKIIEKKYIVGKHVQNNKLKKIYSRNNIVLNDHWDDMREMGFISNRIFDVLACNGLLISDEVKEIPEDIRPFIHTYTTRDELVDKLKSIRIEPYLTSRQVVVANHSFDERSLVIDKRIKELLSKNKN